MTVEIVGAGQLKELATEVLRIAGTRREVAAVVARALVRADLDGIASHGVAILPYYAEHVRRCRVDGAADPQLLRVGTSVIHIDARHGFAYPAIQMAVEAAVEAAHETGIACVGIARSHHSGVLGHPVEDLASQGLVGLMLSNNAPLAAGPGGSRALFGTNPIAFACPRAGVFPLVVDLATTVAARSKILLAAARSEAIPEGWALGPDGKPTTDATAALKGTLLAMGGSKGAALALAVEILTGALVGSQFSFESTTYYQFDGPRFSNGHLLLAIDPSRMGGAKFVDRIEEFCAELHRDEGVRLPGERRFRNRARLLRDGIPLEAELLAELRRRAGDTVSDRMAVLPALTD
jgi:(2R)-3-sulfolactate dehydrogenase (NADP+)